MIGAGSKVVSRIGFCQPLRPCDGLNPVATGAGAFVVYDRQQNKDEGINSLAKRYSEVPPVQGTEEVRNNLYSVPWTGGVSEHLLAREFTPLFLVSPTAKGN